MNGEVLKDIAEADSTKGFVGEKDSHKVRLMPWL